MKKEIDAIALLKGDHRKVEDLFKKYDEAKEDGDNETKYEIAKKVCGELLIHMQIEEEIFYPAMHEATSQEELLNEAEVEHAGAKDLIIQLGELEPEDPMFDAKITVLKEQIEHHVKEEESELFPSAKKSGADMEALGAELMEAKQQLQNEYGVAQEA